MRRDYQISTGYAVRSDAFDVGAVVRPRARDRYLGSLALTIRLDVESLDEQIARESDAAERDHEAW